jgi:hypothetical protein
MCAIVKDHRVDVLLFFIWIHDESSELKIGGEGSQSDDGSWPIFLNTGEPS